MNIDNSVIIIVVVFVVVVVQRVSLVSLDHRPHLLCSKNNKFDEELEEEILFLSL